MIGDVIQVFVGLVVHRKMHLVVGVKFNGRVLDVFAHEEEVKGIEGPVAARLVGNR